MLAATISRYRTAFAGLPREAWLLALALFANRCGTMVMPFMTLYLTSELKTSEATAGRMISIYGIGAVAGSYLGGRLARSFGEVRLQIVCLFAAAPLFLLMPLWAAPAPLALNVFVLSVAFEMIRPANAAAIAKLTAPAERTRAFALTRLAANLGFSCGPAIGGLLSSISFNLLFAVDAASTLAAAAVLWFNFGMRRIGADAPSPHQQSGSSSPLADRRFVVFLVLSLMSVMVYSQYIATYPLYLRDHYGLTKPYIGMLFAVNTVIIVACEMVLVDAIRSWPLVRTIGWGTLITCVGFGVLPFGSSLAFAIVAMIVLTIGEMLSASLAAGYVATRSHHAAALYMGWFSVIISTGYVLGPAAGAELYQLHHDAPWFASLALGAVLLVGYELLARGSCETVGEPAPDTLPDAMEPTLPVAPPGLRLDDASTTSL